MAVDGEASLMQPRVDVRVTPDRPITVTLQVTDCDLNTSVAQTIIGIELPFPSQDASP